MKKVLFALALLLSFYSSFSASRKETPVIVLGRSHDIFYFKICKAMVGGVVEVYSPQGNVIETQNLDNRKLIIDFFDMAPGDYTIKVKKDGTEEVFTYHRRGKQVALIVNSSSASKLQADPDK